MSYSGFVLLVSYWEVIIFFLFFFFLKPDDVEYSNCIILIQKSM